MITAHVRRVFIFLTLISFSGWSLASQCPASNVVLDPPVFEWTHHPVSAANPEEYYSGTLEMGEASFVINGETLTTRAYRQQGREYSIPAPTFIMQPGKKYVLQFRNLLPYQAPSPEHNVYKDPDITNVHTHGLHISGESPSDDVTRYFEGGFGGDYVWDIPADHMGGTYWYHAHKHGSTFLQVSSGAFGMIIIDDSQDDIPANVAAMQERHLVMGYLDSSVAGTGGDTIVGGDFTPKWTINGKVSANLCLPPNTWQHWRILVADRDARIKNLNVGESCEVALLARDGVWRTEVPKMLTTNSINLTGASRADLAVRCSGDSSISLGTNTMAQIFVDGTTNTQPSPFAEDGVSTWQSKRPAYLKDLRGATLDGTATIRMGARTINGKSFDINDPTLSLNVGGVHEWSLRGATNHPFHLHIYHVQVQGNCGDFEDGEYYDVVSDSCSIRFNLDPATSSVYDGRTIMHCHILEHEDQGAMGWLDVIGGKAPPTFPVNGDISATYSPYYPFSNGNSEPPVPPTGLSATAISASQINLSWTDNANNEDRFDVLRSSDGVNFVPVASVAANQSQYSDSNLLSQTEYFYQVNASNANGTSANSNLASATTLESVAGTQVQVRSITVSTVSLARGLKAGSATVIVEDDQGNLIAGATVSGEFSGTFNEVIQSSAPTNADGVTTITSSQTAKGSVSVTFCVTAISAPALADFVAQPPEVCGSL
ncbi:multicopper oxidase domain-containing protein [Pseudoalteromonas sp. SSDWG2]|uniref:multicopper oxidase domain-containing protein n=1 Tax=Pseudoalteromonas sp. SSDWG2 TaxID=3139391 RepID=UPI003BAB0C5A